MAEGGGFDAGKIEAQLDVDRTPFQEGLRLARQQADEFARAQYAATLGADTAAAEAHVSAFKGRLDEIARERPTATINVDTGKADAQVALLDQEVRKLKRDARDAGDNGLKSLWTWGMALGPAVIPVVAAAGAGVAGLGAAFGAAAAGGIAFGVVAKGAFTDIEKAQKKITAAEAAYTKATTDPARAKALLAEKQAWDSLTPSEQAASKALTGLEDSFHATEKALQPIVLSSLVPWLNTAKEGVGFLTPLVTSASSAIGGLGSEAEAALGSPYWRNFFAFLSREAQPAIFTFGQTLGNVAHGFAGVMQAFDPMVHDVEGGMVRMSAAFAHWGAGLSGSGSFQGFMSYVQQVGPQVFHTIGDVASALGHVLAAAAPLGPPLLEVVDLIAKLVGWQPQIVALGIAVYGWTRLFNSTAGAVAGLTEKLLAFRGAEVATAGVTAESGAAAAGASTGFGLLGAALAAVAIPLALSYSTWQKNTAASKDAIDQATTGVQTFNSMNATLGAQNDKLHESRHWWSGYTDLFQSNEHAANRLTDAQQRLADNVDQVTGATHASRDQVVLLAQAAGVKLTGDIGNAVDALKPFVTQNYNALTANSRLTGSLLDVDATFHQVADKNKSGLGAYSQALQAVFGVQNNLFDQNLALKDSQEALNTALKHNGHSLDINTKAGKENAKAIDDMWHAGERQAGAAADQAYRTSKATTEQGRQNDAMAAGNRALAKNVDNLIAQGEKAGYSKGQMVKLLEQMGIIDKTTAVGKVIIDGLNASLNSITHLETQLNYLTDKTYFIDVATRGTTATTATGVLLPQAQSTPAPHRASGGPTAAGMTYLIGEHGPEYWTSPGNGYVTPNSQVPAWDGGQARGGDSAELLSAVRASNALLAQQNALLRAQIDAILTVAPSTARALNSTADQAQHSARTRVR